MGNDLGHTLEDRRTNAWRVCRLCKYMDDQGIDVICAILSIFPETQQWNRESYTRYFEVYIDVPMDELVARDQKGLYSRALSGQIQDVVGFDIPFQPPNADLVVSNGKPLRPPTTLAAQIAAAIDIETDKESE
jgi:adenylylsulfate kinase